MSEPVLDKMGFPAIALGERNEAGQLCGKPLESFSKIVKRLTGTTLVSHSADSQSVTADKLSQEDLAILNSFAAEVAGVERCTIRAIYGCGSCDGRCKPSREGPTCRYGNW